MGAHEKLAAKGLILPKPAAAVANYVPVVRTGHLVFVSGQLAFGADGNLHKDHIGKLGADVSEAAGRAAAQLCALNVLAQVAAAIGSLDPIVRCVRLGGFINCTADFTALAGVMNGASDLMVDVFGEAGRHARSTIGVAQLPLSCAVEVEAVFEVL